MSKCKAVLDSEKITEIRVKTKVQQSDHQGTEKTKSPVSNSGTQDKRS